ncbi:MAG: DUF1858 domain-containing protein [bacterium]|nr:DUF1858 domain-containing protein [bacterium]
MAIKRKTLVFHKDMTVGDAVALFPDAADILMSYGLHCVGCHANSFETIEMGVMGHGYSSDEVTELIDELNEAYRDFDKPKRKSKVETADTDLMEISLTAVAAKKIEDIMSDEGSVGKLLRVEVRRVGDQLKYSLNFIDPRESSAFDKGFSFAKDRIKVVVDKRHYADLNGLEIDYLEEEHRAGFKMNNPNVLS